MKRKLGLLGAWALLGLMMLRSDTARQAAAGAVSQAMETVFPSLFPFFVISRRLTGMGVALPARADRLCLRTLGVPAAGLEAALLGLCGGYPLGVYAACERFRSGALTKVQTQRLLAFCNNTGPAVFFGMVGALLFPDTGVCVWLFLIHIMSAVLTALCFSRSATDGQGQRVEPTTRQEGWMESVTYAAAACARLCACVVVVAVLLALGLSLGPVEWALARLPADRAVCEAVLCALTDLPSGLRALGKVTDPAVRMILCAGAVSWGGMCVHMQAADVWGGAGVKPRGYFAAKTFQALSSCAMAAVPARLMLGAALPLWPAAVPFFAAAGKKALEFFRTVRYNRENRTQRRRRYAVSQKDRARLRLLRPGGAD